MPRPKRNRAVIALLESLLADALAGDIKGDIFIVFRDSEGEFTHAYDTDDLDDLLHQVQTERMTARIEAARADRSTKQ